MSCSGETIKRYVRSGELRAFRHRGRVLIPEHAIERFVAERLTGSYRRHLRVLAEDEALTALHLMADGDSSNSTKRRPFASAAASRAPTCAAVIAALEFEGDSGPSGGLSDLAGTDGSQVDEREGEGFVN